MIRFSRLRSWADRLPTAFAAFAVALTLTGAPAHAADPIKIGFSVPLTGALASGGKVMLITLKMWEEEVNARGGLLGRPRGLPSRPPTMRGKHLPRKKNPTPPNPPRSTTPSGK